MNLIDNADHWRARANEFRIAAECILDFGCQYIMLGIAAGYGRLADRIEAQDVRDLCPPPMHAKSRPAPHLRPQIP